MSRLHTSFVLGYHGCLKTTGEKILAGRSFFEPSENNYDWLGPGVYFWESDPYRAWEWALNKVARKKSGEPFVLGAVIDLGNCLDLMARDNLELVKSAYESLKATHETDLGLGPLTVNARAGKGDGDMLLRRLDCAALQHLHTALESEGELPFDTVRGLFTEGGPLFPGSGFQAKTHIQIAVRTLSSIKGVFRNTCPTFDDADPCGVLENM